MALRKYSTEEQKRVKATLRHLDTAVAVLQQEVMRHPYYSARKEELRVKESQLAAYLASEQERLSLMAGVKELQEGEMPGKLMSAKVKTRKEKTIITSLQWNGVVRKDSKGILEVASEFYADLFSEPTPSADSSHWPIAPDKRIGEAHAQLLVADWSEAEVKEALDGMAKGKSPGADGIPNEFFCQHWDSLGGDLLGFVKRLADGVSLIADIVEAAKCKDEDWYLLLVEFQKAFNSVSREYLFGTMERMGFPRKFVQWCEGLHAGSTTRLLLNGWLGEPVAVRKGVQQGCPLAPYLFLCAVEPLCQEARRRKLGISNPYGNCLAYLGYADDTTLVLKGKRQIGRAVKLLNEFGEKSGLRVNNDKSALLPLGRNLRKKPDKSSVF
ncbi:unnamed protein product [Closterium sp. Yama58-4]|nr:unnamed protein product [Closterium sp. Yama58-4]